MASGNAQDAGAMPTAQHASPSTLARCVNPAFCRSGVNGINGIPGAVEARWEIPGVADTVLWTPPMVQILPAQELTIVDVGFYMHVGRMALEFGSNAPGGQEFLVRRPPTWMPIVELRVRIRVYDQDRDGGDAGDVAAKVNILPCKVDVLLSIIEALANVAVEQWPDEPETKTTKHEGEEAMNTLLFPGQLGDLSENIVGSLEVTISAKKGFKSLSDKDDKKEDGDDKEDNDEGDDDDEEDSEDDDNEDNEDDEDEDEDMEDQT